MKVFMMINFFSLGWLVQTRYKPVPWKPCGVHRASELLRTGNEQPLRIPVPAKDFFRDFVQVNLWYDHLVVEFFIVTYELLNWLVWERGRCTPNLDKDLYDKRKITLKPCCKRHRLALAWCEWASLRHWLWLKNVQLRVPKNNSNPWTALQWIKY